MNEESDNESLKFNQNNPLPKLIISNKSEQEKIITLSEENDVLSNEDENHINIETNVKMKFTPKRSSKHKKTKKHKKVLQSDKKRKQIRRLHYGSNRLNIIAMVSFCFCNL